MHSITLILSASYFLSFTAYNIFPPFFPNEAHKRGINEAVVGVIMSFYFVSYAIIAINMGTILKKTG